MTNDHPRIFDPRNLHQQEEFLSGRWTLKSDELRVLFDALPNEDDWVSAEEYNEPDTECEESKERVEELLGAISKIQTACEEVEGEEALVKAILEIADNV